MLAARFPLEAADEAEAAQRLAERSTLSLRSQQFRCLSHLGARDAEGPVPARAELTVFAPAFSTQLELLPFDRRSVTAAEVRSLGDQLYRLLAEFTGYDAAAVGWDPENRLDLEEWETELGRAELGAFCSREAGLVLSDSWCSRWQLDETFVRFDADHRWIPYAGTPIWWP